MSSNIIAFPKSQSQGKVGRPRLGNNGKNKTMTVRVTEQEKQDLELLASKSHITPSMFLRVMIGFALAEGWQFSASESKSAIASEA